MKKLMLSEIAKAVGGQAFGECEIANVSIDSRDIAKGYMYVAIIGERFDGHDFVPSAAENGASAVMVSKKPEIDIPYVLVDDTEKAFLALGGYCRDRENVLVVGVTGSVGKTTTKEMLASVLECKYKTLKTEGNLNNQIGLPKMLLRLDGHEAAVLEMGMNHKGEISNLSKAAKPDIAVITTIGVSHIENLGSREGIRDAKLEILDGMKKGSTVFVNKDCDMLNGITIKDYHVKSFGINSELCYFRAEGIREENMTTSFKVVFNSNVQQVTIPTVGIHNVYNALAAFAVGIECHIPPRTIAKGLMNYKPSGMRQNIKEVSGVTVIEDCYNASPDSMRAALKVLSDMKLSGRKIAVLGDMLELGDYAKEAHGDVGKMAYDSGADYIFCFGGDAKYICEAAEKCGHKNVWLFDDKQKLADKLTKTVKVGDGVLFKASRGMKLEDVIEALYDKLGK